MTVAEPVPTEIEREEPYLALGDTRGEPNWSGMLQRHWREFKGPTEVIDAWSEPVGGAFRTRTETRRDAALVRLPMPIKPRTRQFVSFHPMQEWEGTVTEVDGDTFTARLTDLTADKSVAEEEADFLVDDITDDDRQLLVPGAIFRWAVGYQRSSGGSKKRVSHIVFRRLPMLTEKDAAEAKEEGAMRSAALKWE